MREFKKKEKSQKPRRFDKKKSLRNGTYSIAVIAIAAAAVVVINLIVGALPSEITQIDMTTQKLYTIGDTTKEILTGLDEDVTLYYITDDGSEDDTITRMLDRYKDASTHISVVKKDVTLYPTFTQQYTADTVSANSVIAVCGDKSKVVDYNSIYEQSANYQTYSYDTTGFDGEGQITSAIDYVTSDNLPVMYILTGHDEITLPQTVTSRIQKENVETRDLNLISEGSVPSDAACLLINAPGSDLSEAEAKAVIEYLDQGGRAIIMTSYTGEAMPNFDSVLESYGVSVVDGCVFEGDPQHCASGYPLYMLPTINSTTVSSDASGSNKYVMLYGAQGITFDEAKSDTITEERVLTTSDSAYSKIDVTNAQTAEKEEGDIDGPFDLAVYLTKDAADSADESQATEGSDEMANTSEMTDESTDKTQLFVVGCQTFLDEQIDTQVSGGNTDLFVEALGTMCGHGTTVSIDSKSLSMEYLTVPSGTAAMLGALAVIVIPGVILAGGLIVWAKRRKR